MMKSILLAAPDSAHIQELKALIHGAGFNCDLALNGRDAQAKLYKQNYEVLVIHSFLKSYPSTEVLKYLKQKQSKTKVIFLLHESCKEEFTEEKLKSFSIDHILDSQTKADEIKATVQSFFLNESWRQIKEGDSSLPNQKEELNMTDKEFVKVPIKEFTFDKVVIFDVFVKISSNRYVKVLHRGDKFERAQLENLSQSRGLEYLYFMADQQGVYINFTNELLSQKVKAGNQQSNVVLIKNISDKYVNEVYLKGIKANLIDEGKRYAQNVFTIIEKDKDLAQAMKDFAQVSPDKVSQNFLVSFFAAMIAKNLDWCTYHSIEKVIFASLLCDIGLQGMPANIKNKAPHELDGFEFTDYCSHPFISRDIIKKATGIPPQVDTIVEQHHEYNDGTGFPKGISGIKIYPLAKAVSLATYFVEFLMKEQCKPIEGIRALGSRKEFLEKHDVVFVKALIKTFISKG